MSLASFAYALCIFWLIVHALQRLVRYRKEDIVLPSHRSRSWNKDRLRNWHVTIRFLHARVETPRWNETHDRLLNRLKKRGGSRSRMWLETLYALGFASGVVGMIVAFGLLIWTAWALVKPLLTHKQLNMPVTVGNLMKRDMDIQRSLYEELAPESPITPILPGVTVPLGHIPFIFAALFSSQVVHEIGHAVAGALYGVPILSSGASLGLCFPAAFVSFSTAAFDSLHSSAKSRIIAAGPFHNLLFWCFWVLVGYLGGITSGIFLPATGYKDISSLGRVVLSVDQDSPLAGYLMPGTIITKLNDHSIASSGVDPDPWSSILKSPSHEVVDLGWCVEATDLNASTKECCLPEEINNTSLSCFSANTQPVQIGCLNPVPVLTSTDDKMRCASGDDCKLGTVCVRPAQKENLLRLTVRGSETASDHVVLWTGPREEIWDEVVVGIWLPRFSLLPLSLPLWPGVFREYMVMINLSLFLFNLVPIAGLDGSHFLRTILGTFEESRTRAVYSLEALERGEVADIRGLNNRSGMRCVEKMISGGAICLVGLNVVFAVLVLIQR